MADYAIVGMGMVDSLGVSIDSNWNRYLQGHTNIEPIRRFNPQKFPTIKVTSAAQFQDSLMDELADLLTPLEYNRLDRYAIAGLYTVLQAFKQCTIKKNNKETAVVICTAGGGSMSLFNNINDLINGKKSSPRQVLATQRDALGGIIGQKLGFYGANVVITSACASGLMGLDYGIRLLADDTYEQVIVCASDCMISPHGINVFQALGALDTRMVPISMPFDVNRQGFVIGEGSATLIIKKLDKAKKDGDKIYSIIKGMGVATESYHETSVSPDGVGGRSSINMALKNANLSHNDIEIVNTHATSTPNGDGIEYDILSEYFPNILTMALKANIGHTIGASSLIELIYLIKSLETGLIGPVANLNNPIGDKILLPNKIIKHNARYGLKNSFGFGGKSASIILEKVE